MKNLFKKSKKEKFPKGNGPRPLSEIQNEYGSLLGKAAEAQYKAYVYTKELNRINALLESINQEAAQRNELDAALAKEAAPQEEKSAQ